MKIGLVPLLYNEYNYGGVLQFYALQRVLNNSGYETDIIFFENDEMVKNKIVGNSWMIKLKVLAFKIFNHSSKSLLEKTIKSRKIAIDRFKKKTYSNTVNAMNSDFSIYSAIICGSDQIWNPNWARRRCFLEFVPDNVNKIIYAASLGVEELSDEEKALYKPRIQRLQHVSVREYSAKKILDAFVERDDIEAVLDPTLLIKPDQWTRICDYSKVPNKKYVLTYFLGDYSQIKKHVDDFAHNKGLDVLNIPFASGERVDKENYGDIKIYDAAPDEFLGLIEKAEYIFTDSFHACVFSTMFKKEFYVIQRDGSKKMAGRIHTLFQNLELPNRFIPVSKIAEKPHIDYTNKEALLEKVRATSMRFLTESINE